MNRHAPSAILLAFLIVIADPGFAAAATPGPAPGNFFDANFDIAPLLRERLAAEPAPVCVAVALVNGATPGAKPVLRTLCKEGAALPGSDDANAPPLFEIGSISKAFTAVILADMVVRKEASLDDPVAKFLPAGIVAPANGDRAMTLRDLATQTSGLPRLPPGFRPKNPDNPYADMTADEIFKAFASTRLTSDPGSRYEYSNFGYIVLTAVIVRIAKQDYGTLLRERIFKPLAMADSTLAPSAGQQRRFADGHDAAYRKVPHWDFPENLAGVGGIRSSLPDMTRFLEANLGLRPSELDPALALSHAMQRAAGPGLDIGLAWHIRRSAHGDIVWHNGGTAGFRSFIGFDMQRKTGVVVLADSAAEFDDLALHLLDPASPLKKAHAAITLPEAQLDACAGTYEIGAAFRIEIARDADHLRVQATGQPAFAAYAETSESFFLRGVDAKLTFTRDAGVVTGIVLHQGGRDTPGRRLP